MALTAFLPTGTPQILPFIGTPGAGTVGHALVWSQSPQGFTLSPISVGPDQFSGVLPISKGGTGGDDAAEARTNLGLGSLATQNATAVIITGGSISGITPLPVASGGTGSNNGSITGTGALTFAAGGTNQDINLAPSGTGIVSCGNTVVGPGSRFGDSPLTPFLRSDVTNRTNAEGRRLIVEYNVASNAGNSDYVVFSANRARGTLASPQTTQVNDRVFGFFTNARGSSSWQDYAAGFMFEVDNIVAGQPEQRILFYTGGSDPVPLRIFPTTIAIYRTTESTSTTNGAFTVAGGVGVAKNVNIGGNLRFAGGTVPATATSAGTTGDVRYDSSHLYICTATNTWRRTALSTW